MYLFILSLKERSPSCQVKFGRTFLVFFFLSFGDHLSTSIFFFLMAFSEMQYFNFLTFGCVVITQKILKWFLIYNEVNAEKHPKVFHYWVLAITSAMGVSDFQLDYFTDRLVSHHLSLSAVVKKYIYKFEDILSCFIWPFLLNRMFMFCWQRDLVFFFLLQLWFIKDKAKVKRHFIPKLWLLLLILSDITSRKLSGI